MFRKKEIVLFNNLECSIKINCMYMCPNCIDGKITELIDLKLGIHMHFDLQNVIDILESY